MKIKKYKLTVIRPPPDVVRPPLDFVGSHRTSAGCCWKVAGPP